MRAFKRRRNMWKWTDHLSFSKNSTITVNLFTYFLIRSDWQDGCHKTWSVLRSSLKCFGLSGRVEPDSAHDGDKSRRPCHPKSGDISIPLPLHCLFFQYRCIPSVHQPGSKLPWWNATMVCGWNLGTRPPIRISDTPSWTYDTKDSETKVTWILRLSTNFKVEYADWYNEINSSPDILGCCVFESWLN